MALIFENVTTGKLSRHYCPICGKLLTARACRQSLFRYCDACDVFVIPEHELEVFLSDYAGKSVSLGTRWQADSRSRLPKLPTCRDNNVPMPSFILGKEMRLFACRCPQCGDVCVGQNELILLAEFVKHE